MDNVVVHRYSVEFTHTTDTSIISYSIPCAMQDRDGNWKATSGDIFDNTAVSDFITSHAKQHWDDNLIMEYIHSVQFNQ